MAKLSQELKLSSTGSASSYSMSDQQGKVSVIGMVVK